MGKIEKALERFNLNYNFTDDELKKAYNEKSKVIEVDFINKKKNTQSEFDYQILVIYKYIRDIFKDIDINQKGLFNIPIAVKQFYQKEPNRSSASQLFDFLKKDTDILDDDVENAKTKEELEKSFNEFIKRKDESCMIFVNALLEEQYNKENINIIQEIIFSDTKSIKEIMIETYNFATNSHILVTERFKAILEETYEHDSDEYRKGINYYMQMKMSKSYEEAQEIYDIAVSELFNSNTKSNLR